MSDDTWALAITALVTVGIALLNYGLAMIQRGDTYNGIIVCLFGAALILIAVLVAKMIVQRICKALILSSTPP